jgi:hypothetical protein
VALAPPLRQLTIAAAGLNGKTCFPAQNALSINEIIAPLALEKWTGAPKMNPSHSAALSKNLFTTSSIIHLPLSEHLPQPMQLDIGRVPIWKISDSIPFSASVPAISFRAV